MKNIIFIVLMVSSVACLGQKNMIAKSATSKEVVYEKLLELDKWYMNFSDTISFSGEYNEFYNNSHERISDSIINIKSIRYISLSKNIFDKKAHEKMKKFIRLNTSSTLFLGTILCSDFECQDLEYIVDSNIRKDKILEQIQRDKQGNWFYRTILNQLIGYTGLEEQKYIFFIVRFKKQGETFKVHAIEIQEMEGDRE